MRLGLTEEQRALRDAARGRLGHQRPPEVVRDRGLAHDPSLWRSLVELGWLGLGLPTERGGAGSLVELGVACEEAGRFLVPTTFGAAVGAGRLLAALGGDAAGAWLARLAAGDLLAAVAWVEDAIDGWPPLDPGVQARRAEEGGWRLSGTKRFVPAVDDAEVLLVVARNGGRGVVGAGGGAPVVAAVDPRAPGVTVSAQATFAGDPQATVAFDHVELAPDHVWPTAVGTLASVRAELAALAALELAGVAQRAIDLTVAYVKERVQFDRPIGSFQAVQHQLADLGTQVDAARLAAYQAAASLAAGRDATGQVAVAKLAASRAAIAATLTAHQLHGAAGFTTEHPLSRWSDRAVSLASQLGTAEDHVGALADALRAQGRGAVAVSSVPSVLGA